MRGALADRTRARRQERLARWSPRRRPRLRGDRRTTQPVRRHQPDLLRRLEQPGRRRARTSPTTTSHGPQGRGDRPDRRRGAVRRRRPDRQAGHRSAASRSPSSACWRTKGSTGFQDADDVAIAPLPAVQQALTGYGALNQIIVAGDSAGRRSTPRRPRSPRSSTSGCDVTGTDEPAVPDPQPGAAAGDADRDGRDVHRAARRGRRRSACWSAASASRTSCWSPSPSGPARSASARRSARRARAILGQFLVEATLLSLLGGVLGVAAALVGSRSRSPASSP